MFENIIEWFDIFIRKITVLVLMIVLAIVFIFDYQLYGILQAKDQILQNNLTAIQKLQEEIKKDEASIMSLRNIKTNVLYLTNKVNAINIIKTVLKQYNINYVMNIDVPSSASTGSYFKGLNTSNESYIESQSIISKEAKMGVFHYIPAQIIIKNYVNYDNLMSAVNELIENNFIITQVASKATFGNANNLILGGRIYVSK